jgi:hypothetical protein
MPETQASEVVERLKARAQACSISGNHLMAEEFDLYAAEISRLSNELQGAREALADPGRVHVNMLHGTIAKPSLTQFLHALGNGILEAVRDVVEIAARNETNPAVEKVRAELKKEDANGT